MTRALILTLTMAAAASAQEGKAVVPALALKDQFDNLHDVRAYRGSVLVLVYGDRASAQANATLGEAVHVHFHPTARGQPPEKARRAPVKPLEGAARHPDVVALPVACIGKVPVGQLIIARMIRANAPVVPVLLDFSDAMKAQFPFSAGVPNVVVLDAEGRYRYASAGVPTAAGQAKLLAVIESLRKEAAGVK
jgi:hypothetical protein